MRVRTIVLACVIAAALGACGGSGSKSTSGKPGSYANVPATSAKSSSGSTSSGADACKLLNQDDAAKLFGMAATQQPGDNITNAASECLWHADGPDNHGYLLQTRIYNDEAHYGEQVLPGAKHLDGLGDRAFTRAQGTMGAEVQFVRDGKTYAIAYSISNVMSKDHKDPMAQLNQLVNVLKANISRL